MDDYPQSAERRSEERRHRTSGLRTGRRSTDGGHEYGWVAKATAFTLIFLIDVVCLAGDALLLRNDSCL